MDVVRHFKPTMRLSIIFLLSTTFLVSCSTRKVSNGLSDLSKLGPSPLWLIDSIETHFDIVNTINPMNISNISVLLPKTAKKKLGDKAIDGAIYVTTVKAAKSKYWSFFSSKSNEYKQAVRDYQADSSVVYVLNGQTLSDSAIGTLFLIDEKNLRQLHFVRIDSLQTVHSVSKFKKQYVLNIKAKRPRELKNDKNWK
jgi:hypothetical protein